VQSQEILQEGFVFLDLAYNKQGVFILLPVVEYVTPLQKYLFDDVGSVIADFGGVFVGLCYIAQSIELISFPQMFVREI